MSEREPDRPPDWADDRAGLRRAVGQAFAPLPFRRRGATASQHFEGGENLTGSAEALLLEAKMLFDARREQALRAEARATTLMGSVAIAIGLAFTGSAFLLDPANVQNRAWNIALAVVFAALLFCLAMTGYVASRATIKVLPYAQPTVGQVMRRGCMSREESDRDQALHLLRLTDHNAYFSLFKVKQVEIAGLWYRASLGCFAALSLLLVAYTA